MAAQKTKNLFDAGSVVYKETLFWCVGLIGVLSILGIIYELVTRKKRDPNPKRYGKLSVEVYMQLNPINTIILNFRAWSLDSVY